MWACPGRHREVETAYHQILGQLSADDTLRLTDVAVLVTDMEAYLPLVHGVFGQHALPYNVVDANAARASRYAAAVTALLNLIGGGFSRRAVFALLRNPCYLAAHDADGDMADQWLAWVVRLGIFNSYRLEDKCRVCDNPAGECRSCRESDDHFDPAKLERRAYLAGRTAPLAPGAYHGHTG